MLIENLRIAWLEIRQLDLTRPPETVKTKYFHEDGKEYTPEETLKEEEARINRW